MESIRYVLSIFLIVLFIIGQIYFIGFIVSVLDWYCHIKPEVSTLVLSVAFFILSYYVLLKVDELELIFLPKSFTSFKSYLYFLVISSFSLFWSVHVIVEAMVNKKIKEGEVLYNAKSMCLYHTKVLYEEVLSSSVQADIRVIRKLYDSSIFDLKSGKLRILFTYVDDYYDEDTNKFKHDIRTYTISNGIVKISYKHK